MGMAKNRVTKLSLLSSLVGLATVYAVALSTSQRIVPIAKIDESFIGTRVTIAGQIVDIQSSNGHLFLKVRDGSNDIITVPIFSSLASKLTSALGLLDHVEVRGSVSSYEGELEVVPSKPEDVRVVHTAPASILEVSEENVGQPLKVYGIISSREIVGAGNIILTLKENGAKLKVFVPSKISGSMPEVHVGDEIMVGGWLQLYNDELELKVTSAVCVQKLEAPVK